MTPQQFADRMNRMTGEEIAQAMESLPTDALEWGVKFEALGNMPEKLPKGSTLKRDPCVIPPAQPSPAEPGAGPARKYCNCIHGTDAGRYCVIRHAPYCALHGEHA
jgi:hypothetical protein